MTKPTDLFDVSGKIALVTGGTRGIGEMIATGLLQGGAKVYITSRKADACTAMQDKLSAYGTCIAHPSDLSTHDGVTAFTDWFSAQESKLDILVNNAGAAWGEPIEKFSEAGWDRVMDLNVKSIFFMTQKLLPQLRAASAAAGRGRIINIGSIEGFTMPMAPGNFAYPASKAAVHHLTRSLARGEVILAEDLALVPLPQNSLIGVFHNPADLVGRRVKSAVTANRPVKSHQLEVDFMVDSDSEVLIVSMGGGISVDMLGFALENGQFGDWINVENASSGKTIRAKIIGEKKVAVMAKKS